MASPPMNYYIHTWNGMYIDKWLNTSIGDHLTQTDTYIHTLKNKSVAIICLTKLAEMCTLPDRSLKA